MIRIQQIKVPIKHNRADIEAKIRKILKLKPGQELKFEIYKQSIDARRKNEVSYVYTVDVEICADRVQEEQFLQKLLHKETDKKNDKCRRKSVNNNNIMLTEKNPYLFPQAGTEKLKNRPVIVGSGPAGLFCAYLLASCGYQPIIIERGKKAAQRQSDVGQFWQDGVLNGSSNVQFGEGGAGTFSDGKLNTLVKDPVSRNRFVLETFVKCGADSSILYVNKPHIGTDVLVQVITNLRKEIVRLGGTFYFETCFTDFERKDKKLCSITVVTQGRKKKIAADLLVLAIGHSARDTFEMLNRRDVLMEAKAFAVGFRVEHPQEMINLHQYQGADMRYLPTASYKVTADRIHGQRGVYSFCMCPGGYVVNASSEEGHLAVNGMSYQKRDGKNANSAIIVSVTPDDFPGSGKNPLGGIEFQREMEAAAYALGDGKIPQQLYGDYQAGRISTGYGDFASQTKGKCAFADLNILLPESMKQAFISGMERFAGYIPGFNRYDAILSGIESRTSSPVRILRGETGESIGTDGIYPCGEGAGYAGGIMSAAMDGMKTSEAMIKRFQPFT